GGINERWFSSTTKASNGPATLPDEGLSYARVNGRRFLLKAAIDVAGDLLLGSDVMSREGGWNLLCKFFDNMGPIPHHLHQSDALASLVGQRGKPEAYYFPPQYNLTENNFPYTFMGLQPGTGWQINPGILHAPGSLVTYEPQVNSDVFAMFQSVVEGRIIDWSLLTKDVRPEYHHDLDYLVDMLDWNANVNPEFGKTNKVFPKLVRAGH